MITKHQLIEELPEFEAKINKLKTDNTHFKKLFDTYTNLDQEIYRIESDAEPASDEVLNNLRMDRVHLKDEIYSFLLQK